MGAISPDIVTINETHYKGRKEIDIAGYLPFQRNRITNSGGGIATLVKSCDKDYTIRVKEGKDQDEYLITKHDKFVVPINVIDIYGESECRTTNQEVEDRWFRVVSELKMIESKGEFALIIGDLNKHVGKIIKGNHQKISFGGKLVTDLVSSCRYVLLNASNKVTGGPFTRFDPATPKDEATMSCLDLVIASQGLVKYLDSVIIDRNQDNTPFRPLRGDSIFPDHYSIQIKFKNLPLASGRRVRQEKKTI